MMPRWVWPVVGGLAAAWIILAWFHWQSMGDLKVAEQNLEALQDESRTLTDSLDSLNGRRAAERLALQAEVTEKDEALRERERQLGATTQTLSKVRIQRDSFAIVMTKLVQTMPNDDSVATWAADSAGIHARTEIQPPPDSGTQVRLRIHFEPMEVLQAFLQDDEGRVSLLAIADSLHEPTVIEVPTFIPPPKRGLFNLDLGFGSILATGVGCAAAGGVAHLLGSSAAEAGAIAGACAGSVVALKVIL